MMPPGERIPNDDFMADGMEPFWGRTGKDGRGRRDLSIMRDMGANTVRLYGNDPAKNHTRFLQASKDHGLDVIAGFSDYPYTQMHGSCLHTKFYCYDQIKKQYVKILKSGFLTSDNRYHPSLRTVILMNEPDLKLLGKTDHFCRALVSAFDAVIDAEKELGVKGVAPNFTVAFSFGVCPQCARHGHTPGIGQMLALREAMKNPKSVDYTPRNDLWLLYKTRFVNSVNTANPAYDVRNLFLRPYEEHFQGTPVFIGEYHSPEFYDQQADLEEIMKLVHDPSNHLIGMSFFEFQVRYDKGGAEMSFGMFGLDSDLEITKAVIGWEKFPTHCLTGVEAKSSAQCGQMEEGLDYVAESAWGFAMDHIVSAQMCCAKCKEFDECKAWTWVEDAGLPGPSPSQCWVKGSHPVRKDKKLGVISGVRGPTKLGKPKKHYVHEVLARAFGGAGVELGQACPVATTRTLTTTTETRTTATTQTSTTEEADELESASATWPSDKDEELTSTSKRATTTSLRTTYAPSSFSVPTAAPWLKSPSLFGHDRKDKPRLWPWPSTGKGNQQHIIKAISYDPLPVKTPGFKAPGEQDFMSRDAEVFWGREGSGKRMVGRRDLWIMRRLGANAVRLYSADPSVDHSGFLDEAQKQNLDVIAGISDYLYLETPGNCLHTNLDCFHQMKDQYSKMLSKGFLLSPDIGSGGSRTYHPALRTVVLLNKPDVKLHGDIAHFFRALISAFDGVLEAEKEAGVAGAAPNLTVTFSFAQCRECAPSGEHPGLGQMLALRGTMREPTLVQYNARNDLWKFYKERFMNSIDTTCDAEHLRSLFLDSYDGHFQGTPVFIAEYHAPSYVDQATDLQSVMGLAKDPSNLLLGISFFEYQVRYDEGCAERSYGMFGLSDDLAIAVADIGYGAFTSWCLTPVETRSPGNCNKEEDVLYEPTGNWSLAIGHIPSAEMCCTKCKEHNRCNAWSWVADAGLSGCPSQCTLQSGSPTKKVMKPGSVSGTVPGSRKFSYMHEVVADSFEGAGIHIADVCPVTTTTSIAAPEGARHAKEDALRSLMSS